MFRKNDFPVRKGPAKHMTTTGRSRQSGCFNTFCKASLFRTRVVFSSVVF